MDIVTLGLKLDASAATKSVNRFEQSLIRLRERVTETQSRLNVLGKTRVTANAAVSINKTTTSAQKLNQTLRQTPATASRASASLKKVRRETDGLYQSTMALGFQFRKLYLIVATIGTAFGGMRLGQIIMDMETLRMGLNALEGSAEAGGAVFDWLADEADRLGLNLESSAHQFKLFNAATKGTALEGQVARDIFTSFSEAITVMGLSADDATGVFRALQQMVSKGSVNAEELRQQLGERLPSAFRLAAEAMGVTQEELNDMLKKGEVMAEDLLPKMAELMKATFGDDVVAASQTLRAEVNRLSNEWMLFVEQLGGAGLYDVFAGMVSAARSVLGDLTTYLSTTFRADWDYFWTTLSIDAAVWADLFPDVGGHIAAVLESEKHLIKGAFLSSIADPIEEAMTDLVGENGTVADLANKFFRHDFPAMLQEAGVRINWEWDRIWIKAEISLQEAIIWIQTKIQGLFRWIGDKFASAGETLGESSFEWVREIGESFQVLGNELSETDFIQDNVDEVNRLKQSLDDLATQAQKRIQIIHQTRNAMDEETDSAQNVAVLQRQMAANSRELAIALKEEDAARRKLDIKALEEDMRGAGEEVKKTTEATKEQVAEIEKLKDAYSKLVGELIPLQGATQSYAADVETLQKGFQLMNVSVDEQRILMQILAEQYVEDMNKMTDSTNPWKEAVVNAVERIDSAFADLWKSAFSGFKDFGESLKGAFLQLLAELAHMTITRPIVIGLTTAMGGGKLAEGLEVGGGIGDLFSLFGGGGGNTLSTASNLLSAGGKVLSTTSAMGSLLSTGAGMQQSAMLLGDGFLSAFGAEGVALTAEALGTTAAASFSSSVTSALVTAAPYLAAALAVYFVADAIGLFDDKTDPRVGLAFGTKGDQPTWFEDSVWKESALGLVGFRGASHEFDATSEEAQAFLDMIVGLDNALAGLLTDDQAAAAISNLEDWESILTDLEGMTQMDWGRMLADRFGNITSVLESEFGQKLDAWVQNFTGTTEEFVGGMTAWVTAAAAVKEFDLSGVLVDDLAVWLNTFEGSGEEFLAGTTAWIVGMKALQDASFESVGAFGLGDTAKGVFEDFFSAFMNQLDPAQFEAGATAFASLVQVMDFDPMVEGARMFEEANRSAWESLGVLSDGVWDAINSFDGSVESVQRLAQATGSFKGAAAQMIAAIEQIKQSISGMTANTIEQMKTSLMSEEEKANYYIDEANRLKLELATMTDPAEIESTVAKINELVLGAFNLLPEEMRAGFLDFAEPFLLDTEELAKKRLEEAKKEITDMTTAIEGAITSALGKVAADFQAAANSMNAAANAIPTEIDANVTVTVNNTGGGFGEGDIYSELGA